MPIGVVGQEQGRSVYGRVPEDPKVLKLSVERRIYKLMAEKDQLTGALTRHGLEDYWTQTLPRLIQREAFKRQVPFDEVPVGFFLGDVVEFKPYNKLWGHAGGDRALVQIFERIRQLVRPDDGLSRPMGDEILIVLPGISLNRIKQLRKEILAQTQPKIRLDFAFISTGLDIHEVLDKIEHVKKEGKRGRKMNLKKILQT